jgi:major membrane immunogen (membrane-anchored lipoprotein)
MTLFYSTSTWSSQPQPTEKTVETWKHASTKSNWRIVQLPNGFYQTEIKIPDEDSWKDITRRETIEGAEAAIEASIEHYNKKLGFLKGPKVVKTFE